jgi:hypothetical protein
LSSRASQLVKFAPHPLFSLPRIKNAISTIVTPASRLPETLVGIAFAALTKRHIYGPSRKSVL